VLEWHTAARVGVNQALRQELLALVEQDHAFLGAPDHDPNSDQVQRQRLALLGRLRRQLVQILDTYGWPGKSLVGDDGAEAAWLLALHTMPAPARACPDHPRGPPGPRSPRHAAKPTQGAPDWGDTTGRQDRAIRLGSAVLCAWADGKHDLEQRPPVRCRPAVDPLGGCPPDPEGP